MKKKSKRKVPNVAVEVSLTTSTVDDFFKRSVERARKLDRGEKLPAEIRFTFEDPADLMRVLSAQRIRVLLTVRAQPRPVSDLALVLKRDRKAVSRDVKVLESFGLVRTHEQPNPGHGLMKIVEPLAARYQLVATI
jgi:predicted transcriptional regulator